MLAVQDKIDMPSEKLSTFERCIHSTSHITNDGTARHDVYFGSGFLKIQ